MENTAVKVVTYLTSVTLGMVLLLFGPGWSGGLGGAMIFAGSRWNPFPVRPFNSKSVCYAGLLVSLGCGVWQFIQAERYGYIWLRVPPSPSFVVLALVMWLSLVVGVVVKLCQGHPRP